MVLCESLHEDSSKSSRQLQLTAREDLPKGTVLSLGLGELSSLEVSLATGEFLRSAHGMLPLPRPLLAWDKPEGETVHALPEDCDQTICCRM